MAAVTAPAHVTAVVTAVEPWGDYVRVVLAGDPLGGARPGQFVTVTTGTDGCLVAARAFAVHEADPVAATVALVVAVTGPGSRWLTDRRRGERVGVTGPLGRGFTLPDGPGAVWVGVGGGYGAAVLGWAARTVLASGGWAGAVVGAADARRLCDVPALRRQLGGDLHLTTDDGSRGRRGTVLDALPAVLDDGPAAIAPSVSIGACGPMRMLAALTRELGARPDADRYRVELAVEERMACGVGVCMTCVLPVVGGDGVTRMTRTCVEGPVLDARRMRWDAVRADGADVPQDAEGAMAMSPGGRSG